MEFLKNVIIRLQPYDVILLGTLLLCLYYHLKGYKSLPYLFYFILIITFFEVILQVYWVMNFKTNLFIYLLNCLISISYYFYIYYQHFKQKNWSKLIVISFFIWLLFAFLEYDFNMYSKSIVSSPYLLGLGMVSVLILKYAYDIIYIDEFRKIDKEPLLYFSVGIFVFFVSSFIHLFSIDLLVLDVSIPTRFRELLSYVNIILTLGYLIAALCSKKE
jgi:hypothetical protein